MKVGVVRFPGSNCDEDVALAVEALGAQSRFLWHRERALGDLDLVILPGGFSYGDYLRAGAIASLSPIMGDVVRFAEAGGPVLGICNGFQILCETGLLPGALVRNQSLKFHSHDVHVRVEQAGTRFTADYAAGQVLRIPVANAEGNYRADPEMLAALEGEGRVVFRYCDAHGDTPSAQTLNKGGTFDPSGSANHIAGIISAEGNVLGMMPHPERAMDARLGSTDGRGLFTSLLASLASSTA